MGLRVFRVFMVLSFTVQGLSFRVWSFGLNAHVIYSVFGFYSFGVYGLVFGLFFCIVISCLTCFSNVHKQIVVKLACLTCFNVAKL